MSFPRHERSIVQSEDSLGQGARQATALPLSSHRRNKSQPVIPWRVALQQGPLPLHQPVSSLLQPAENITLHPQPTGGILDQRNAEFSTGVEGTKRVFDILLTFPLLLVLLPLFLALSLLIKATSKGPAVYWSNRVGKDNMLFRMPKFRSMRIGTPELPTHLFSDPAVYLTPIGRFMRRTSLDELPQLWSILTGKMSFVGPRPALFNQDDLVALRTERGVHVLVPGLTGWAQVNGRDELPIPVKVELDYEYLRRRSLRFDLQIICMTALKVLRGDGIQH
jgi:O-antigen biosynthesis protein WbqP